MCKIGLQAGNYDKTYYLEPGEGGAKAYALLRRAMEQTGRIALARVMIRSRESLAAVRVFQNGVLALETMHYPDEVRSAAGLTGIVEPELRPRELEMAIGLVNSLSADFEPEQFENQYRQAVLELIQAKVAGQEILPAPEAPQQGRVADLMDALRASIQAAEEARGAAAGAGQAPAPPAPPPVPSPLPAAAWGPAPAAAGPTPIPGAPGLVPGISPGHFTPPAPTPEWHRPGPAPGAGA